MVETVDRHGLKKHFLKKHLTSVERFYRQLERTDYQSEAALKCKERFVKNRDKLFTFLNYDGVPWHNNNAEHAIKAFSKLRDITRGSFTERSVENHKILLSICQTCKYSSLDFFLNFFAVAKSTFMLSRRVCVDKGERGRVIRWVRLSCSV